MVEIIDKTSDSKSASYSVEQDENYLKILKEQKQGTFEMKVYLFNRELLDSLYSTINTSRNINSEEKNFFEKVREKIIGR
jgi:hypothetical protein